MAQETTEEFAHRFGLAVEGHPLAPPTPHGRQRWVLEKLKSEVGLAVSPNTMSKWFRGTARPRTDNIRKIAQVLSVDEVWLGSGRKPVAPVAEVKAEVSKARGAVLALAGTVEMSGGRVTFPDGGDDPSDLHINIGGSSFSAIVVCPKLDEGTMTYLVPEPVGDARVLSVSLDSHENCSVCLTVLDLTDCPRQSLGGYSVIVLTQGHKGQFSFDGGKPLLSPVGSLQNRQPDQLVRLCPRGCLLAASVISPHSTEGVIFTFWLKSCILAVFHELETFKLLFLL